MPRIRNWQKFQHYKHRNPPWIKLYREILDDREWHELSGESAKGLISLWCIAAEAEGELPDSTTLAFRMRISENRVLALLSECSHWIEMDTSNVLARCKQHATPEQSRDRVETEKEAEAESKESAAAWTSIGFAKPIGHKSFRSVWEARFQTRGEKEWLTDVMERTIQDCEHLGVKVPPPFFEAKRAIEAEENAAFNPKRVPL